MRRIKSFKAFESSTLIYDADWHALMPKEMLVIKDGEHLFRLGNIMKHSDMVQVTYENASGEWGIPSTLEFDFYFSKNSSMRMAIDITWGDAMACEFYIQSPSEVGVIEYTSLGSKTDPSDTIFALGDASLEGLAAFICRFDGFRIGLDQLSFLSSKGI